ncbi:GntR family transcriptional regulator [Streptosporangium becharense]|uniref:GntR family transcriptional regulator n=1 Tax=Streptosporangium becharense TaxID=1816182 RepID=A0A7W9IHG0_9ACTN|nr:GntR family transcriptional regulator [Streptosporangium becharense]MBB2914752.1 GntR family transcriptional regulator [Streptosporangium becharense]MBB5820847.1 GntR family transcriptional regulator [Streptosporangium becharense]
MDSEERPRYLRIADELRALITSGQLADGDRLPSIPDIVRRYQVADGTARDALRALVSEGLAVAKPGSGTYVRTRPQLQRLVRAWYRNLKAGSPFTADMERQGRRGSWDYDSRTVPAPPDVRERLGLGEPDGDRPDVMRTDYTFKADGQPVMLSTSWEPLSLTRGTPVVMPEEGPHGGRGVVERMLAIGVTVDGFIETVGARLGTAEECTRLQQPSGSVMLTIDRRYPAGERVVEVADILLPADLFQLVYSGPTGEG